MVGIRCQSTTECPGEVFISDATEIATLVASQRVCARMAKVLRKRKVVLRQAFQKLSDGTLISVEGTRIPRLHGTPPNSATPATGSTAVRCLSVLDSLRGERAAENLF